MQTDKIYTYFSLSEKDTQKLYKYRSSKVLPAFIEVRSAGENVFKRKRLDGFVDFSNNTVGWSNDYASYQLVYNSTYDKLSTEDKNKYVAPTEEERELAKRYSGTVSIKIADQNIPACKAIKIKS